MTGQTLKLKLDQLTEQTTVGQFQTQVHPRTSFTDMKIKEFLRVSADNSSSRQSPRSSFISTGRAPRTANKKPEFWYPSSYENVTMEELGGKGKRAIHIGRGEKKLTTSLKGRLIRSGKGIPTKKQLKSFNLNKKRKKNVLDDLLGGL